MSNIFSSLTRSVENTRTWVEGTIELGWKCYRTWAEALFGLGWKSSRTRVEILSDLGGNLHLLNSLLSIC